MFKIAGLKELNQKFENGDRMSKNSFEFLSMLGSGAFGKVYRVKSKKTKTTYALKVLSLNQLTQLKLME